MQKIQNVADSSLNQSLGQPSSTISILTISTYFFLSNLMFALCLLYTVLESGSGGDPVQVGT